MKKQRLSDSSRWVKIPNIFPHYDQLPDNFLKALSDAGVGQYQIRSINDPDFVEVRTLFEDTVDTLIELFGYDTWKEKYSLRTGFFERIFLGSWKRNVAA